MYNSLYFLQKRNLLFVSPLSHIALLGLVISFLCFLPAKSIAQQDVTQRFQQKINKLEQRIERLENLLGTQTSPDYHDYQELQRTRQPAWDVHGSPLPGVHRYQGAMYPLPVITIMPLAEVLNRHSAFGVLMGKHPPFDAPIDDIEDSIDHCAHHIEFTTSTGFRWWDH